MSGNAHRWVVGLLVVVLGLQGMLYSRLGRLEKDMQESLQRTRSWEHEYRVHLNNLAASLSERNTLPDWLAQPVVRVDADPTCLNNMVTVNWSLREWGSGTTSRLQYRRGSAGEWEEPQVAATGQQSYQATFPIAGGPGLLWTVYITDRERGESGSAPRYVYLPPVEQQYRMEQRAEPALQYRIVMDDTGSSRTSSALPIPLGPEVTNRAAVSVVEGADNTYKVTVGTDAQTPATQCGLVGKMTTQALANGRLLGSYPLEPVPESPSAYLATWTAPERLTRIDLSIEYGSAYSTTLPIDLVAP